MEREIFWKDAPQLVQLMLGAKRHAERYVPTHNRSQVKAWARRVEDMAELAMLQGDTETALVCYYHRHCLQRVVRASKMMRLGPPFGRNARHPGPSFFREVEWLYGKDDSNPSDAPEYVFSNGPTRGPHG